MEDVLKLAGVIALGVFGGLIAKEVTDRCRIKVAEKLNELQEAKASEQQA